jgi:hypothetical protein
MLRQCDPDGPEEAYPTKKILTGWVTFSSERKNI